MCVCVCVAASTVAKSFWRPLIQQMYNVEDQATLMATIEAHEKTTVSNPDLPLPYRSLLQVLLNFQLEGRVRLLQVSPVATQNIGEMWVWRG